MIMTYIYINYMDINSYLHILEILMPGVTLMMFPGTGFDPKQSVSWQSWQLNTKRRSKKNTRQLAVNSNV